MQINGDVLSVHLASGGDIHYASDDLVILTTIRSGPKAPQEAIVRGGEGTARSW